MVGKSQLFVKSVEKLSLTINGKLKMQAKNIVHENVRELRILKKCEVKIPQSGKGGKSNAPVLFVERPSMFSLILKEMGMENFVLSHVLQ